MICAVGTVGAVSDDSLNNMSEICSNDGFISAGNEKNQAISCNNDSTVHTQKESSNTSEYILKELVTNKTNNVVSSKSNLKITNYTNFVTSGTTFYLYLKDLKGNSVANKKLTINYGGKTYYRTTDASGKFGIKVTSSKSTSDSMNINFKGDKQYNSFSKSIKFYVEKSISINIGNSKLLTNGYLRVYLKGPKKKISGKTIEIIIGKKVFTKKSNSEGFVVIKPKVSAKTYDVVVKYNKYSISKRIKCIKGNVKNPLKTSVPTVKGIPDIDSMPSNFVMGDNDAKYTLKKSQYMKVIKRDSYCLFLYGKLSKYTFFKTKESPKVYHILKREKWNVIERAINTKLVKMNKYKNNWPKSITVKLKGKSYTYSEVRDIQNTEYTCGPTSASVCSQVLKKFNSDKYFQIRHMLQAV